MAIHPDETLLDERPPVGGGRSENDPATFGAITNQASTAQASTAAAAAPSVPADSSVQTQLDRVLDTGGPLLTRARTRAAQTANRRGLLNSAMAVQAGEAAVLDVALPIASQTAQQLHQSGLSAEQIEATERLQERELGSRSELQAADIGSRETIAREAITSEETRAAAELASRQAISEAGIASTEKIAASNITAYDLEKATAAIAQFDKSYQEAFQTISQNEKIPAAARDKLLRHLAAVRDSNFNLVEQLYNISLEWTSPAI